MRHHLRSIVISGFDKVSCDGYESFVSEKGGGVGRECTDEDRPCTAIEAPQALLSH